jgi:hypothetical protein
MKGFVALVFGATSFSTLAYAQDCTTIQDAAARLACFDKPPAAAKAGLTTKPAPQKNSPGAIVDSGWELKIKKDGFTDKTSCVISPVGKPNVQITVGHLYISYAGQGGVAGFTPRLDDQPPRKMQLPTPIEQQISAVHFGGEAFYEVMAASRLRVQTFTILHQLKDEDLQLEPAKRLYKKIPPVCGA